jgi:hypothetical protein
MDTNQFFSREITISKSLEQTYDFLLKIPQIKYFVIESENKVFGKIIYQYFKTTKIEILVEKVSDEQTKLKISIMDRNNSYYKPCDLASSVAANFENALSLIIEGKQEMFKPQKASAKEGCFQIILFILAVISIAYGLYAFLKY